MRTILGFGYRKMGEGAMSHGSGVSGHRKIAGRDKRKRNRRQLRRPLARHIGLEPLEPRELLALAPLTLSDPGFWGNAAFGQSSTPSISADGQLVVFESSATNIVPNRHLVPDGFNTNNVFVYNRATASVSLVSQTLSGDAAGGGAFLPLAKISPNGRYVAFASDAPNLAANLPAGNFDGELYLRDLETGVTIALADASNVSAPDFFFSANSNALFFVSRQTNLTSDPIANNTANLFRRELSTGVTQLVSVSMAGQGVGVPYTTSLAATASADGRFVAFISADGALTPNDTNNQRDVFVRDMTLGTTTLVSVNSAGTASAAGDSGLVPPMITPDGSQVAFVSAATDVVSGLSYPGGGSVLFVRDLTAGSTRAISVRSDHSIPVVNAVSDLALSADGTTLAFVDATAATTGLVPEATYPAGSLHSDVYVTYLGTPSLYLVSVNSQNAANGDNSSGLVSLSDAAKPQYKSLTPEVAVSGNGQYVYFVSAASNLVNGQSLAGTNLYRRDLLASTTVLVSATSAGGAGNGESFEPAISTDGRYVGFTSFAKNLVAGDSNMQDDIFLRDMTAGTTGLVSLRSPGVPAPLFAGGTVSSVSADGTAVLLTADASAAPQGLYALGIPSNGDPILVRNSQTGAITPVNVTPDGALTQVSIRPSLSADGKSAIFLSGFPLDGAAPVSNGEYQLYVRQLDTRKTRLLSRGLANNGANASVSDLTISSDGRFVAFVTSATNLISGFVNAGPQAAAGDDNVYLWDRQTDAVVLVSHAPASSSRTGNDISYGPVFNADGSQLAFTSKATDLVSGVTDTNGAADLFVYNIASSAITLASSATPTTTGNAASGDVDFYGAGSLVDQRSSFNYGFSADNHYLLFESYATNLVTGPTDTAASRDIFRRDLVTGTTVLVTTDGATATHTTLAQTLPMSADGQRVAFMQPVTIAGGGGGAEAENVSDYQVNAVFVRDLNTGTTSLVSAQAADPQSPTSGFVSQVAISPDGNYVAFTASGASDLVPDFTPTQAFATGLYLRNLTTGITSVVSTTPAGTDLASVDYGTPLLFSAAGTLFFQSKSSFLAGDRNNAPDVFAFTPSGTASIRGTVYGDANANGAFDPGETGLPLWLVYLDVNHNGVLDPTEPTALTDASGNYAFLNLAAGSYTVAVQGLAQYATTAPPGDAYAVALATSSQLVTDKNFGIRLKTNNLGVTSVTAPIAADAGRSVNVSWTVLNSADEPASGAWQDAIYLSTTPTPGPDNKLLATVPHVGVLAAHASYNQTASVDIPAALPGKYFLLVQTSRRSAAPPAAIGLASGSAPIAVNMPSLSFAQAAAGNFDHPGQTLYYQLPVNPGDSFTIAPGGAAAPGMQLLAGAGRLPNNLGFDASAAVGQPLNVPVAKETTYYIAAKNGADAQSPPGFMLSAALQGLTIQSIEEKSGANSGRVTLVIHGTQLFDDASVTLTLGSTVLTATSLYTPDSSLLYATFDLTGAATGDYTLKIQRGGETASLSGGFSVVAGTAGRLEVSLTAPPVFLAATGFKPAGATPIVLNYANTGDTDITLPMVKIVATAGGKLNYLAGAIDGGAELNIMPPPLKPGLAMLPPHTSGQVTLYYLPGVSPGTQVSLDLFASTFDDPAFGNQMLDWTAISSAIRPAGVSDADWNAYIASERARYGDTYASLYAFLVAQIQSPVPSNVSQMAFINGEWRFRLSTQPYYDGITSIDPERSVSPTPKPCPPAPTPVMNPGPGDGNQQIHVLILGAADYRQVRQLGLKEAGNLYGAFFDAVDLADLFTETYNAPDVDIRVDEPGNTKDDGNLTKDKVLDAIKKTVAKGDGDDLTIIIDSSHGIPDIPGVGPGGMLMPNGDVVTAADLNAALQGANGPTMFIDDSCYSGNATSGINATNVVPVSSAGCNQVAKDDSFMREFMREAQKDPHASIPDLLRRAAQDQSAKRAARNEPPQNAQFNFPPGFNPRIERPDSKTAASHQMHGAPAGGIRGLVVAPADPNEFTGTAGYGDQHFVKTDQTLANTIRFENDPLQATAPAREVFVTEQLSPNLDWSTFEFGAIQFGSTVIDVPSGLKSLDTSIGIILTDGSPLKVNVTASLNEQTGIVNWALQSVDPATGQLPINPLVGFLPIDDADLNGQGSLQYFVKPKAGLASGMQIIGQASIVFDVNDPLATNSFINTIDSSSPTSQVNPLPAVENARFTLSWGGSDGAGSGVATYDVFVSDNGAAYVPLATATAATSVLFTGQAGHTYQFYARATDNVGFGEVPPGVPDAQTQIGTLIWHNYVTPLDATDSAGTGIDGIVAPGDALTVINYINAHGAGLVPANATAGPPYIDTWNSAANDYSGDNVIAPADALAVINWINSHSSGAGEGEASTVEPPAEESMTGAVATIEVSGGAGEPASNSGVRSLNVATSVNAPTTVLVSPPKVGDPLSDLLALLATDVAEQQAGRRRRGI